MHILLLNSRKGGTTTGKPMVRALFSGAMEGMPDIAEFIGFPFVQRGLVAGLLAAVACSVLSVFVVLRRMAFIGQGISHSAFAGIALGLLVFGESARADRNISLVTLAVCILVAFLIAAVTRRRRISEDSAIGIFLATGMAVAVVLLSFREQYTAEVMSYLFGNVLAVTGADVRLMAVLAVGAVGVVLVFLKELYAFSFDPELAEVSGIPVRLMHYGLLALLAVTIVLAVKVVGVVLVSAFLVIPAATALSVATRFNRVLLLSLLVGVISVITGLVLSFVMDLPSGATMVLVQFVLFACASGYARVTA